MAFTVQDLKLPADKLDQMNVALGGAAGDPAAVAVQGVCDEAAADVARLSTGYVLDAVSITNFTRALALARAYGYIGPVPPDVQKNADEAKTELEAIAGGKRPNLPKVATSSQAGISGGWGSNQSVPGRIGQTKIGS